ncbi:unnamed protein product [Paramecium octaurelia]|uniref:Transmembrane protein n=1 Tax=Paramecium octaurelia TaxID=43137 RepID=A0A8S1SUW9_PAROT|nr:unnamed protein product [Paramecium octaurelia]
MYLNQKHNTSWMTRIQTFINSSQQLLSLNLLILLNVFIKSTFYNIFDKSNFDNCSSILWKSNVIINIIIFVPFDFTIISHYQPFNSNINLEDYYLNKTKVRVTIILKELKKVEKQCKHMKLSNQIFKIINIVWGQYQYHIIRLFLLIYFKLIQQKQFSYKNDTIRLWERIKNKWQI